MKLIVDLIYEGAIAKMHQFISETAKYGNLTRGPRVVNEETRKVMKKILSEIQNGEFARDWILEYMAGRPSYYKMLEKQKLHPVEKVGAELRKQMSWIKPEAVVATR